LELNRLDKEYILQRMASGFNTWNSRWCTCPCLYGFSSWAALDHCRNHDFPYYCTVFLVYNSEWSVVSME